MNVTQVVVDSSSRKDWWGEFSASVNIIPSSTSNVKGVINIIDLRKHVATIDAKIAAEDSERYWEKAIAIDRRASTAT